MAIMHMPSKAVTGVFSPVMVARKRFIMGPASQWIEPGDVVDLSDPGWGLPRARAEKLVEHHYGESTTDPVSVSPLPTDYTPAESVPVDAPPPSEFTTVTNHLACPRCPRTFPTAHGLTVHIGRQHKES